ncbi:MAG: hypothetical protein P4L80_12180 [Xanthobacteraceae bacterium]|nr:hypothetical protein [Xanthobacteraceae bacterium]
MTFKPGDRVRLKTGGGVMAVKVVEGVYVLCEAWPRSGIDVGVWPVEALERAPSAPVVRPATGCDQIMELTRTR